MIFFSEGLSSVKQNDKYGYINKEGIVVIAFLFDKAYDFFEGAGQVCKKKEYYFINEKGTILPNYRRKVYKKDIKGTFDENDKWGFRTGTANK